MGALDFLFEGRPPPSVNTYGTVTQNVPQFISDYTQGLIARANAVGGEGYQAYGGPRIAGFTNDQNASRDFTRNIAGNYLPVVNDAISSSGQATGAGALQTASRFFDQGVGLAGSSSDPSRGGLQAAQPFINQASGTLPENIQRYMNPYVDAVTNRSATLAKRTFDEQLNPAIEAQFVRNGQRGSTAQIRELQKGTRDITENLQQQTNAQLADAYDRSAGQFNQDQNRFGDLAQLTGGLTNQDRGNELGAAQLISGVGTSAGNLGINQAQQQLASSNQMGALAQLAQSLGYRDAGALDAIGTQEQNQNQRNLDLAYGDFSQQRDYPRQTVEWLSNIIRGLPTSTTTTSNQVGPGNTFQPSGLAQIGALGTALGGIFDVFKGGLQAEAG